MDEAGLDALLLTHPANVRYLTGFSGSGGMALALPCEAILVVDPRYAVQAPAETAGAARVEVAPRSLWEGIGLVAAIAAETLGFEADHVTVREVGADREAGRRRALVATEGRRRPPGIKG